MSRDDQAKDPEEEAEDFASLLDGWEEPRSFEEGETVEGRIVSVGREVAFVDVGGKGEATIDLDELTDEDGSVDVRVGDVVQAVVVSIASGLKLSHRLARGAATRERLGQAYRAGLPVEGKVERAIRGGFEVRLAGQRAFCPVSQIDTAATGDSTEHEGRVYTFRILEYGEDGKNIVVSRRALLEEEERERAEEVRRTIVPGADLAGRVVSVRPYGAFVDLGGGIQGLVHVSEMGWSRVTDPASVVEPGDEITVRVLRVDEDSGKIALGLKQLQLDPWTAVADTYEPGQVLRGKLTRLAEFGAFVELEPGVEGLAHASTFPPTGKRDAWRDAMAPGTEVVVELLEVDAGRKRIGLAVVEEGSVRAVEARRAATAIAPGSRLRGTVERHERYGVLVFLAPGRTGLLPAAESGFPPGTDLRRALPPGSQVEVVVLEVDEARRRIRLSRRAVFEADEKGEAREYAERQDRAEQQGFGSLADKLRAALGSRED